MHPSRIWLLKPCAEVVTFWCQIQRQEGLGADSPCILSRLRDPESSWQGFRVEGKKMFQVGQGREGTGTVFPPPPPQHASVF